LPKPFTENCVPNLVTTKIAPTVGVASTHAARPGRDEDDRDLKRPVL
jgi:hypothetical protein